MNAVFEEKLISVNALNSGASGHPLCSICSANLELPPINLFEVATRRLAVVCQTCAAQITHITGGPFKSIPNITRPLVDFQMPEAQWENFGLSGHMTFVFYSTADAKMIATYPTPSGVVESAVSRDLWKAVIQDNPTLEDMRPDVEAFLVLQTGETLEYFIAPIDVCYGLVKTKSCEETALRTEAKNILLPTPVLLTPELAYAS